MVISFSDLRRRSFRRFGVSGIESSCTPHLELPSTEILKLQFTPPLNRTVNHLPMIYGVDHFGVSGFGGVHLPHFLSRLCEIQKNFTTNSSVTPPDLTVEPSSQIYNVDLLGFSSFQEFAYRDSHTPMQFKRDFNPYTHFPDPTVTRAHLPS
jgi:hypothetical protein